MKKWALAVLLMYGAIIIIFTLPVCILAFADNVTKEGVDKREMIGIFSYWPYWAGFALFMAAQAALLDMRVSIAQQPQPLVTKKTIIPVVLCSALMMALLVAGMALAIHETIKRDPWPKNYYLLFFISWLAWGFVFYRWSNKSEPGLFLSKIRKMLYYGSVLELLVAVPTHILARHRNYCCAGFSTFIGIVFGLAVMFCSFGPGILFIFAERWKRLRPQTPDKAVSK